MINEQGMKSYDLFMAENECFYSPGMRRRTRPYAVKTSRPLPDDGCLKGLKSLKNSKNTSPNARKEEKRRKEEEKKKRKRSLEKSVSTPLSSNLPGSIYKPCTRAWGSPPRPHKNSVWIDLPQECS